MCFAAPNFAPGNYKMERKNNDLTKKVLWQRMADAHGEDKVRALAARLLKTTVSGCIG